MIGQPQFKGQVAGGASPLAAFAKGDMANFRPLAVPAEVADLEFLDGAGKPVRLSDFRGKVVLLNLWATWCVPCREEMPALDALQASSGSDKFMVLTLNVDQKADRPGLEMARDFYGSLKLTSLGLYNDPTASAGFKVKGFGLPTTLLIAPDGREIGRIVGPAHWNSDDARALIVQAVKSYEPSGK
ncbi:MAG: TlpA family protein disulfide reductase [Parvibaculaceae bacterium]